MLGKSDRTQTEDHMIFKTIIEVKRLQMNADVEKKHLMLY